jgi:hypothetical protein
MPILILAAVMFFAMVIATAFALGTEGHREMPVRVRNRHYRF